MLGGLWDAEGPQRVPCGPFCGPFSCGDRHRVRRGEGIRSGSERSAFAVVFDQRSRRYSQPASEAPERILGEAALLAQFTHSVAERGEYGGRVQVTAEGVGLDAEYVAEREQKVVGRNESASFKRFQVLSLDIAAAASSAGVIACASRLSRIDFHWRAARRAWAKARCDGLTTDLDGIRLGGLLYDREAGRLGGRGVLPFLVGRHSLLNACERAALA